LSPHTKLTSTLALHKHDSMTTICAKKTIRTGDAEKRHKRRYDNQERHRHESLLPRQS
jgi:hypothetical protein